MGSTTYVPYEQRVIGEIRELSDLLSTDLAAVHEIYAKYDDEWGFMQAAYEGSKALVAFGAMLRHERESTENYNRRIDEAYGFSYSRSVIDLFNFYLFKEPVKRSLGSLGEDNLWTSFFEDCNLEQDDLDQFLLAAAKVSSTQGHVGILVDKPNAKLSTREDELKNSVYPYLAMYNPLSILDWKYERDNFNRPRLIYLKLKDDEDDLYRIWFPDKWEIWKESSENKGDKLGGEKVNEGKNPLGEIPFVWIYNIKSKSRGLGISDISDIARIDASIIRNLSQGEEIINYAAFPMLRQPRPEAGQTPNDEVGVKAVLEFDPDRPESKADWLEAEVYEPIKALFDVVIAKKVEEIYRASNIGGMAATVIQTEPKSGTALKSEFQLLNSKLVTKGKLLAKAEKEIIRFWLKWAGKSDESKEIAVERSDSYDVVNLSQDLDNILTSMNIIKSDEYNKKIQKHAARLMLPNEPDDEMKKVDAEIDAAKEINFDEPEIDKIPGEVRKKRTSYIPLRQKT